MKILSKAIIPVVLLFLSGCVHHVRPYSGYYGGAGYGSGYTSYQSYPAYYSRPVYIEKRVIHQHYRPNPHVHKPYNGYNGTHGSRHDFAKPNTNKPYASGHHPQHGHHIQQGQQQPGRTDRGSTSGHRTQPRPAQGNRVVAGTGGQHNRRDHQSRDMASFRPSSADRNHRTGLSDKKRWGGYK